MYEIIGSVHNNAFHPLWPDDVVGEIKDIHGNRVKTLGLTRRKIMEAVPLETGQLNLSAYEGKVIMIKYKTLQHLTQGKPWAVGVEIVETAGLILSALVQQIYKEK